MPHRPSHGQPLVRMLAAIAASIALSAQAQPPAALVRVDPVLVEALVQTVPVIGRLVARQEGQVAARVQGPIHHFDIQVGDRVAAGDVIARIEEDSLEASLAQAKGRLGEARARIATAEAQLALTRQERDRLAALKNTKATSKALYDDAVQNEAIGLARVREAQAAAATAQADVRLAEIDLGHAVITAPYTGVVVQRMSEQGAYVSKGDPVVRLLADTNMEVEADVPFDRLGALGEGVELAVVLDDGERRTARVRAVIPEENRLTRTRAVRFSIDLEGAATGLADGQTATVHVPLSKPRDVVSVHKDGINRRGDSAFVYVVEDGAARRRAVSLGQALGSRIEVLSGLAPGERVVVRGNERLRPDDKVRVDGREANSS